jgi:hypothetical protein
MASRQDIGSCSFDIGSCSLLMAFSHDIGCESTILLANPSKNRSASCLDDAWSCSLTAGIQDLVQVKCQTLEEHRIGSHQSHDMVDGKQLNQGCRPRIMNGVTAILVASGDVDARQV